MCTCSCQFLHIQWTTIFFSIICTWYSLFCGVLSPNSLVSCMCHLEYAARGDGVLRRDCFHKPLPFVSRTAHAVHTSRAASHYLAHGKYITIKTILIATSVCHCPLNWNLFTGTSHSFQRRNRFAKAYGGARLSGPTAGR